MFPDEIRDQLMPACGLQDLLEHRTGIAEKALNIVINQPTIDCHATRFDIRWLVDMLRVAQMRRKLLLGQLKFRRLRHVQFGIVTGDGEYARLHRINSLTAEY